MRAWFYSLACGLSVATGFAAAPSASSPANRAVEQVQYYGRGYVRLKDWAQLGGFAVAWQPPEKSVRLNGSASRIELAVDSDLAEFKGTQLRLCYPLIAVNGVLYLAALDMEQTFKPLLNPPRNDPNRPVRTIVLDPGHGGKDPGFKAGSALEKRSTLLLAKEVQAQLTKAGYKVYLTRTTDTFVGLEDRASLAKRRGADLFVSLHFNSGPPSVSGIETYCMTPAGASSSNAGGAGASALSSPGNVNNAKNMRLAYELQRSLVGEVGAEDREVRRARFEVLREASVPAALIEAGYLSNSTEKAKILDAAFRRRLAKAIVDGIQNYKRAVMGAE